MLLGMWYPSPKTLKVFVLILGTPYRAKGRQPRGPGGWWVQALGAGVGGHWTSSLGLFPTRCKSGSRKQFCSEGSRSRARPGGLSSCPAGVTLPPLQAETWGPAPCSEALLTSPLRGKELVRRALRCRDRQTDRLAENKFDRQEQERAEVRLQERKCLP